MEPGRNPAVEWLVTGLPMLPALACRQKIAGTVLPLLILNLQVHRRRDRFRRFPLRHARNVPAASRTRPKPIPALVAASDMGATTSTVKRPYGRNPALAHYLSVRGWKSRCFVSLEALIGTMLLPASRRAF